MPTAARRHGGLTDCHMRLHDCSSLHAYSLIGPSADPPDTARSPPKILWRVGIAQDSCPAAVRPQSTRRHIPRNGSRDSRTKIALLGSGGARLRTVTGR